jgi:phosphate transport system permease protein
MSSLEPAIDLRGRGRTRRRLVMNRLAEILALIAALLAVAVLGIVVWSVAKRGASQLSLSFLTGDLPLFGQPGGGIAPLIVGTAVIVGIAALIAVPVGVLIAIFTDEFAPPRLGRAIQLVIDLMNGLPSIIIAIFIFGLIVYGHPQSGLAGSYGLAIVMLPLVTRSTQEVLRLVPRTQREGALALGASRWRTVLGVVLPSALGGIVTGTVLAVARAVGETAPLLFVTSIYANTVQWDPRHALPNMPVQIFIWSESEDPADHERAWATALVLIVFVLVTSLAARVALARNRRNMGR